jgi:hypothetical protein
MLVRIANLGCPRNEKWDRILESLLLLTAYRALARVLIE